MKSKEKTKQKKHESTIGKIIYGFLLFMPLLAIGVTCAYAIFNKNAYQSYSDKYVENLTLVNNSNNLISNSDYYVVYNSNNTNTASAVYQVNKTSLSDYITLQENQYITTIYFINDNNRPRINYQLNDGTIDRIMNWQNVCPNFTFNLKSTNVTTLNTAYVSLYLITETERNISDAFYYSIDKVQQSPLFNWAEDSLIYTGMTNTCNALNITTPFIPLLMTYWLIISVIYFLYDIILIILHVFHRKIHELEESI